MRGVDGPSQGVGHRGFALVWQEGRQDVADRSRAQAIGRPPDRHAEHEGFAAESGRPERELRLLGKYQVLFDVDDETKEVTIVLVGELAKNYGLRSSDLGKIESLVAEHEQEIRDAWQQHFGS